MRDHVWVKEVTVIDELDYGDGMTPEQRSVAAGLAYRHVVNQLKKGIPSAEVKMLSIAELREMVLALEAIPKREPVAA